MSNTNTIEENDWFGGLHKPVDSGLTCPITGGRLMSIGYESHVMDPDSFYQSENDPTLYFACHPFSRTVYRLIERPSMMDKAIRYFVLNEDSSWTEHVRIKSGKLVPIDTPKEEIEAADREYEEDRERRKREYEERVARGEITEFFPIMKPVYAKTVSIGEVKVQPMSPPSGILNYLDVQFQHKPAESSSRPDGKDPGLIYAPWVSIDIIGDERGKEYDEFMAKYNEARELCPKCGNDKYMITLASYPLNMDDKESYKDLNSCTCLACGDVHTFHDRTQIYF